MNKRKPNPKGKYIIHSKHKKIPKHKPDMLFISFDPGKNNFDIRIERRRSTPGSKVCDSIETIIQSRRVVDYQRKPVNTGTRSISTQSIVDTLDNYSVYLDDLDVVIIEGQMDINNDMMHMQSTIITYFLIKYPGVLVLEPSSKLKGVNLGAPPGLSKPQLKSWGVDKALWLANKRGDDVFIDYIDAQIRGLPKSKWKIDDDTDNLIQIEAVCVEIGYPLTCIKEKQSGPARLVRTSTPVKRKSQIKSKNFKILESNSGSSDM